MKILVIADQKENYLWQDLGNIKKEQIDLIISCGDLAREYLETIVSIANVPLLYVHGNHDESFCTTPPQGCTNIDGKVVTYEGLKIAGLGGCMKYKNGTHLYTEGEMRRRATALSVKIWTKRGLDIFVTHAPAAGYGDLDDLPHRGFRCFNSIINKWKPKYMLHGHIHQGYVINQKRKMTHACGTEIINGSGYTFLRVDD